MSIQAVLSWTARWSGITPPMEASAKARSMQWVQRQSRCLVNAPPITGADGAVGPGDGAADAEGLGAFLGVGEGRGRQ
ncbi:hypothetical protein [Streptomyces sp. YKOK-I1]